MSPSLSIFNYCTSLPVFVNNQKKSYQITPAGTFVGPTAKDDGVGQLAEALRYYNPEGRGFDFRGNWDF
jgi:hypothetical protein